MIDFKVYQTSGMLNFLVKEASDVRKKEQTLSGDVVSFTADEPAPLKIVVDIDSTGWTGCEVTRTGKNLLGLNRILGTPDPSTGSNATSPRVMDTSNYYVGLRSDNYYYPSNVSDYSVSNGSVFVKATNNAYGIGFPVSVKAEQTYTVSGEATASPLIGVGYYDKDWNYIGSSGTPVPFATYTFTTPTSCAYVVVILRSGDLTNGTTWTNVQLELGSTPSTYEPYNGTTLSVTFPNEVGTVTDGTLTIDYDGSVTLETGGQTYTLTSVSPIETLIGDNNIWADAGPVSVTYPI